MGFGWIGVDLDGTLAEYDHESYSHDKIGSPIKSMCDTIRNHLKEGTEVRLFTARAGLPAKELMEFLQAWNVFSYEQFGLMLNVTNKKDFQMISLYDDRAKQVVPNRGDLLEDLVKKYQPYYDAYYK